jgi:hypothetical protein
VKSAGQLTPVSDPERLLASSVKHGGNDHEAGRNRTLAHTKNEPRCKEPTEILASCVTAERDAPHEDVEAHPLSNWESLKSQILRVLKQQVA